MSSQAQINDRMGRLALAQHEVIMALAVLLVETVQAVSILDPTWKDELFRLVNQTSTAIESATLLLKDDI